MARGRPKSQLMLSEAEQAQLSSIARSRSMPAALTERAQIVLRCAGGESNPAAAQPPTLTEATLGQWRRRFLPDRIPGPYPEVRPRPPRSIRDAQIARPIRQPLQSQ